MLRQQEPIIFDCLNNRTVVSAKISIHHPLLLPTPYGTVCFFNMMKQNDTEDYFLQKIETNSDYLKRLKSVIDVLVELHHSHQVIGFMLQEAPTPLNNSTLAPANSFYDELKLKLASFTITNYFKVSTHSNSCILSTFSKSRFPTQRLVRFKPDLEQQVLLIEIADYEVPQDNYRPSLLTAITNFSKIASNRIPCFVTNIDASEKDKKEIIDEVIRLIQCKVVISDNFIFGGNIGISIDSIEFQSIVKELNNLKKKTDVRIVYSPSEGNTTPDIAIYSPNQYSIKMYIYLALIFILYFFMVYFDKN